jgi:predicted aspartyl protease
MSLPAFLQSNGYKRVPLTRNAVGHFETGGMLAGRPVRVLIDTGAGSTVVSLALAQEMGLPLTSLGRTGGGAGGSRLEIFQLTDANLTLDHAEPRPKALYAMDLSHVNASLAMKQATPVDVILGVDVFESQAAIIDYGTNSLFLKVGGEESGEPVETSNEEPRERSSK